MLGWERAHSVWREKAVSRTPFIHARIASSSLPHLQHLTTREPVTSSDPLAPAERAAHRQMHRQKKLERATEGGRGEKRGERETNGSSTPTETLSQTQTVGRGGTVCTHQPLQWAARLGWTGWCGMHVPAAAVLPQCMCAAARFSSRVFARRAGQQPPGLGCTWSVCVRAHVCERERERAREREREREPE
jgi:hypothetical protein